MVNSRSAAWGAWQKCMGAAEPILVAGAPLAWRRGGLRVAATPSAGDDVAVEVTAETPLAVWALPRGAALSGYDALGSGDPAFDAEVQLMGDARVLAVLDVPTKASLRVLVARGVRVDGGVVRCDAAAAAALPAAEVEATLARIEALAARLAFGASHLDDALEALLAAADPAVVRTIAGHWPAHPAVAKARVHVLTRVPDGDGAATDRYDLAALGAAVVDPSLPLETRLAAARTLVAAAPDAEGDDARQALARLAGAPSVPADLRHTALERLARVATSKVIQSVPAAVWLGQPAILATALARDASARRTGAEMLLRALEAEQALPLADLELHAALTIAAALGEVGGGAHGIALLLQRWTRQPEDAALLALTRALVALEADFDEALGAFDDPTFAFAADALLRLAPTTPELESLLPALYPRVTALDRGPELIAHIARAVRIRRDPRAYDTLIAALASPEDDVVSLAIEALADVGDHRALPHLVRHTEGASRSPARKAAARHAVERIRIRVGEREGGLTLSDVGARGDLTLSDDEPSSSR